MSFYVLPYMDVAQAERIGAAAIGYAITGALSRVEHSPGSVIAPNDDGDGRRSWTADAHRATALLPILATEAIWVRHAAQRAIGADLVEGPWPRSRFTLKVYGPDDYQGRHTDTNHVTALLLLWGGGTPWFDDETLDTYCEPGSLIVFRGDQLPHCVKAGAWRVTVPYNLYLADSEPTRPETTDRLVYG